MSGLMFWIYLILFVLEIIWGVFHVLVILDSRSPRRRTSLWLSQQNYDFDSLNLL